MNNGRPPVNQRSVFPGDCIRHPRETSGSSQRIRFTRNRGRGISVPNREFSHSNSSGFNVQESGESQDTELSQSQDISVERQSDTDRTQVIRECHSDYNLDQKDSNEGPQPHAGITPDDHRHTQVDRNVIYDRNKDTGQDSVIQEKEKGKHGQEKEVRRISQEPSVCDNRKNKLQDNTEVGSNTDDNLCRYCGHDLSNEKFVFEEHIHKECKSDHLPRCLKAVDAFRKFISLNDQVLHMAINVKDLYGQNTKDKRKREKRDIKAREFVDKVSAVRNSDSGHILIHLVGLAPGDNFTGAFDEFADVKLQNLITDGSLFTDVYKKKLLSAYTHPDLSTYTDILVMFVKEASFLVTADVKTKVALDDCIIDTPDSTLLKYIQERKTFTSECHEIPRYTHVDLQNVQESRSLQAKGYFEETVSDDKLVDFVFNKLRIAEYITAFSKIDEGGSYFLGIAEIKIVEGEYWSKKLQVKPVIIKDHKEFEELIKGRISESILVCDYDGKEEVNADLVQLDFISTSDGPQESGTNDACVVHVFVRPVSGIVFYDKKGPVAYKVNTATNSVSRVSVEKWFLALKHRLQ